MSFDDVFGKYKSEKGNYDSLFTIVIHSMKQCDILLNLEHKMELAKTIKNIKKKASVCKKLFEFKEYIKEMNNDKEINSVFLVHHQINEIILDKEWLEIIKCYDVSKFIFKYNYSFEIDFILFYLLVALYIDE